MFDAVLRIAPFNIRLRSPFDSVVQHVETFYAAYPRIGHETFIDFDISIVPGRGLHRWIKPQARFELDGTDPFLPLPIDQAAPLFEWGLNWSIASRPLGYLVMHAAVLARDGNAIVLPGFPGAGKSTLCASLMLLADWQLFSDELAILDPSSSELQPNPRPISLKNESIDVVRQLPCARIGPSYPDTRKGTISHAAPNPPSIANSESTARCRWIVFPQFEAGCRPQCEELTRAEAFALISEQSFNKERMGKSGFDALCAMLDGARCFQIDYGSTEDGLALVQSICSS